MAPQAQTRFLSVQQLLAAVSAGLICGVIAVMIEISLASLIFSGNLSEHVSRGIGLCLFATFAIGMVVAISSPLPSAVAISQDVTAALLGLLCTSVALCLPEAASPRDVYFTVVAAIAVTSLVVGAFLFLLGWFRLGNLVRFIPYPVVGGFLAGIGWLLIKGGLGITMGISFSLGEIPRLVQGPLLVKGLLGLGFAFFLMVLTARSRHFLILPGALLGAVALFYLIWAVADIPLTRIKEGGWLLGPFPDGSLWEPLTVSCLDAVHWEALPRQAGAMVVIALMAAVSLLLNSSGLELGLRRDIDLNRELKSNGAANLVAGLCSGPAGFSTLSLSALGPRLGAHSRVIGIVAALVAGLVCFFGASLLGFIPKIVVGGLVLLTGLSFVWEWLYQGWSRLSATDYGIVVAIVAVIECFGFLQGVALGTVAAVVFFVVTYSRASTIRHELCGTNYQSSRDRSIPDQRLLSRKGSHLHIFRLQGFLFFGTANTVLARVSARVTDPGLPPVRFIVLDFQRVRGLDASGVNCFSRIAQKAETLGFVMVLTGLGPVFRAKFLQAGTLTSQDDPHCKTFADLDHGVEWCEDQLLADVGRPAPVVDGAAAEDEDLLDAVYDDLMDFLAQQEMFENALARMSAYLEPCRLAPGHHLIRQGQTQDSIFFLESGKVTAQMEQPGGKLIRIRTMNPGAVVGELGLYLDYTAQESVVAEQPSVLYRLTKQGLAQMEKNQPELAAFLHKYIVLVLSERLVRTKNTLRAVLD